MSNASKNWASIQHAIGDMFNDEEFHVVRVRLPDGSAVEIVRFEKDAQGWVLVAREHAEGATP